jgi:hypothetical protein
MINSIFPKIAQLTRFFRLCSTLESDPVMSDSKGWVWFDVDNQFDSFWARIIFETSHKILRGSDSQRNTTILERDPGMVFWLGEARSLFLLSVTKHKTESKQLSTRSPNMCHCLEVKLCCPETGRAWKFVAIELFRDISAFWIDVPNHEFKRRRLRSAFNRQHERLNFRMCIMVRP